MERYRPRTLDDIVGNQDTVARMKEIAQHGNMQHLLLAVGGWYLSADIGNGLICCTCFVFKIYICWAARELRVWVKLPV